MVRFRDDAKLDPSQVEDVRGRGPMMGIPGGGLVVGGGGLGVVGVIVYLLITVVLNSSGGIGGPLGNLDGTTVSNQPPGQVLGQECQTGADANRLEDCRIVDARLLGPARALVHGGRHERVARGLRHLQGQPLSCHVRSRS